MNDLNKFRRLFSTNEDAGNQYLSGYGRTAIVRKIGNKHVAQFYQDGEHMKGADYEGQNEDDAHEFAQDEMMHHAKEIQKKRRAALVERIDMPQGHKETSDPISDDAVERRGRVKKMMGNRVPMEIIARILAGKI